MKVAIVASGYGKHEAPLGDPAWECWGLNQSWQSFNHKDLLEKFSRWFELHRRAVLNWENGDNHYHLDFLRATAGKPQLYVQDVEEWPGIAHLKEFPWDHIQALAPPFAYYHACSIDWLIAYAITEGAEEIRLFGIEQDHTAEPHGSRACVEFWSGFAVARGIRVSSADGSTFKLAHLVYTNVPYAIDPTWLPFEDRTSDTNAIAKRRAELEQIIAKR